MKQVTPVDNPMAYYTKLKEASTGKDTMTGHWEMMGLHITKPLRANVGKNVKVKAAGGISSFDDAEKFMSLVADRLGTSRLIKIIKSGDEGAGY